MVTQIFLLTCAQTSECKSSWSSQPVHPFMKLSEDTDRRLPGGELSDGFAFSESFCFFLSPLFPSLLAFFSDILQSGRGISRLRSAVSLWIQSCPRTRSDGQLCNRVSVRWACVFYCTRGGTKRFMCHITSVSVCVCVCVCASRRVAFMCISKPEFLNGKLKELKVNLPFKNVKKFSFFMNFPSFLFPQYLYQILFFFYLRDIFLFCWHSWQSPLFYFGLYSTCVSRTAKHML